MEDPDPNFTLVISIIKILSSLNTTIYFDVIKKEKQLHVSARGHRQVGQVAGTCEYGKEPSGSIKCGEFLG
jgi:hypothetical protein